jgi:site-specific DNA-cytosine methylase
VSIREIRGSTFQKNSLKPLLPTFVDFFAGSGLVTQGVKHACAPVWANDICPRKAAIYTANHGARHFHPGSIEQVRGTEIPQGDIVWASFPCQDLSLAGKMGGLAAYRPPFHFLRIFPPTGLTPESGNVQMN